MRLAPKSFKFSMKVTVICVTLAVVMVYLSHWQWERYKSKSVLVDAYRQHSHSDALVFPAQSREPADFTPFIDKKVSLSGTWDYENQIVVTNKKYGGDNFSTQPGHFLLTPLILTGQKTAVIVSRGFIPFDDLAPETWEKYNFEPRSVEVVGVVKRDIKPMWLGPKNPPVGNGEPFKAKFFYEEISKYAKQLPYEVITPVFIQKLGNPPEGRYPAPAVSVEVPPSTHWGYTIEWGLLAFFTLVVGYVLQAFPHYRGRLSSGINEGWRVIKLDGRSAAD